MCLLGELNIIGSKLLRLLGKGFFEKCKLGCSWVLFQELGIFFLLSVARFDIGLSLFEGRLNRIQKSIVLCLSDELLLSGFGIFLELGFGIFL